MAGDQFRQMEIGEGSVNDGEEPIKTMEVQEIQKGIGNKVTDQILEKDVHSVGGFIQKSDAGNQRNSEQKPTKLLN